MQLSRPRIEVIASSQTCNLWDGFKLVRQWPCSTSVYGLGSEFGSYKTPVGAFQIIEKYGDGCPWNAVFRSRGMVGLWSPDAPQGKDQILARILRLTGLDDSNKNSYERFIYMHGTNSEHLIGQPASHGCIRMRNLDIIELYDYVPVGTPMWIRE